MITFWEIEKMFDVSVGNHILGYTHLYRSIE